MVIENNLNLLGHCKDFRWDRSSFFHSGCTKPYWSSLNSRKS